MLHQPKKQRSLLSFSFKKGENPKYFYALCAIKFLLSVAFTIFKIQKTSNIVLKEGAQGIPSVKLIVFFFAILAAYAYTSLSNQVSYERLSYWLLGFFFGMFSLYAFVIYPNIDALKPNIKQLFPNYKNYMPVKLYGDWPIVFFYLLAELFGQFCIVVFFWGVANDIYNKQQARRFYQWFIGAGCIGGVTGAMLSRRISRFAKYSITSLSGSKPNLNRLVLEKASQLTSVCALIALMLVGLIYKYIRDHIPPAKLTVKKEIKKKPSFLESIRLIYTNSYLIALAVMIICCGVSMNIVQVTYKGYLKKHASSDVVKYIDYEAGASMWINIFSIFACFIITPILVRRLSWKRFATLPVAIIFIFGASFFTASSFKHWGWLSFLDNVNQQNAFVTRIALIDSVVAMSVKYSFFDNVKERAWLGVDRATQQQGKGPIDVVSSRSGKAISSAIHLIFMNLFMLAYGLDELKDVSVLSPYLLVVFCILIASWLYSVNYIGNELERQKKAMDNAVRKEKKA